MFAFVFDESLFAFAYETPPNAFALLFDRYTTRVYMRKSAFVLFGSTGARLTFRTPALPAQRFTLLFFLLICLIYGFKGRDAARPAYYALKASRTPMDASVFDESLFAYAHDPPPNAFATLFDRYTTRERPVPT